MNASLKNPARPIMAALIVIWHSFATSAMAAPPDLTAGGTIPSNLTTTWNLGPTGMRGWVYYDTTAGGINGSVESRQIQVREVDAGSPAAGVFLPNDLILGTSGTAAAPVLFDVDARRGLAVAIADAEARNPAHLKLIRWRAGTQTVVTLTLRTMGAYTATAPYNCPKSEKILKEGMDHYYRKESSGTYRMGVLSLLAAQDDFFPDRALYLQKAQSEARALIKSASALNALRNYTADTTYSAPWDRAHELILLGEYFLITGDSQVFPTIEALAINIAKGASHYGTVAHSLRQGGYDASNSYRPVNTGYGVVNSIGMPCLLGVQLAKLCGVDDPVVDQMIDRAKMFYASYANRGAIAYGEHEAYDTSHENNGKSGLAAIVLDNDPVHQDQAGFFVMMALASGDTERDTGHTGAFFNYLWAALGVQRGGPPAVQEYFREISWLLDLHRRWDGGFDYDSYSENGAPNGSEYYGFRMSTAMLLTYALPLESLHITGRDSSGALVLSPERITACMDAEDYVATSRSTAQLVEDLGVWSPKTRRLAAAELGKRTLDTATRDGIRAMAMDVNGNSRYGAIQALGEINDTDYTGQLVSLLNDGDGYVRTLAAKALHRFHGSYKVPYRESMMTTLVSRDRPAFPIDPADPLQLDQAALITAIFGSGAFANNRSEMDALISQVGSGLFFDALKVASRHPTGYARGRINNLYKVLTPVEVNRMAPELVDMVARESPADRMFSLDVRNEAMKAMARSLVADAVPAAMRAMDNSNGWGGFHENLLNGLIAYGGSSTLVTPDPDVVAFAQRYLTGGTLEEAQALLDAIDGDTDPTPPFVLKNIVSATADDPTVEIAANSTTLRVTATDLAQGDSVFTWRKLSGPGEVTFTPNGTDATASTVQFDGTAGSYQFEVTMSDSRGLTEAYGTVTVALTSAPPLKVFILAGQSNMEGHGEIGPAGTPGTLESLVANDPATFGHLKDGAAWAVRDDAWIWYKRGGTALLTGGVTAGYGARAELIGPELQFGHAMGDLSNGPILIIKTAWGGKSLAVDFRPPGSGWSVNPPAAEGDQGYFYQEMLNHVNDVLANLATYFPGYDPANGYELAGFGWHQGWNDRVDQAYNDEYEVNMANFINDVRAALGKPKLPFVIATTGMDGWSETHPRALSLMAAQLAMEDFAKYSAFEGNVAVIDTRDFWRDAAGSPADQNYHWNRNAGTYFLIGQAMAQEMAALIPGSNVISNPGFENGSQADADTRFTFGELDHWTNNGVEDGAIGAIDNDARSGTYRGMLLAATRIPYQLTSHDITGGETLRLDFWHIGKSGWQPGDTIEAELFYTGEAGAVQVLAAATFEPQVGVWQQSVHQFPALADPSAIGKMLGIRFRSNAVDGRFASIDDIFLGVTGDGGGDISPPTPNPTSFATPPEAISTSAIAMTAATASDPSGPVEYYFTETSGNAGGTDSGWQTGVSYTDTGLNPGTTYSYTVTTRDALGNTGTPSAPASAQTQGSSGGPLAGQLGILDLTANGGINPATGNPWALGDTYRLIFVTRGTTVATSTDISTYNAFVQSEANASTAFPTLGSVSWSVVGSTAAVAARDNTATNPAVNGTGVPILLMDGTTLMATDYANLWSYDRPVVSPGFDQNGDSFLTDRVFTGSTEFGVQDGSGRVLGGSSEAPPVVTTGRSDGDWNTWAWMANWNEPTTESKPVYAMSEVLAVVSSTPQTPFATWAGGEPFDGDKNGDGVDNGIAFLLGAGDPDAAALGLLPAAANDGSGLVLEFSMLNAANRGDAKLSVQWSQDLGVTDLWKNNVAPVPDADGTVNGVVFDITEGDPLNSVKATIPSSEGPDGSLFGRLSGSE
jgi:hypothetical protein